MKKILVVVALLVAQIGFSQEVKWGVKAGYNLTNFDGDYSSIDYTSGFHVGGLSEIAISDKFSLQAELLYSQEGGKYAFEINEPPFALKASERVTLGYLNLPVLAKFYVSKGFSLEAGPQIGLLLSGKTSYESSVTIAGETTNESGTFDIKDRLKSISYGLNLGFGYEFKNKLFLQARYHLGLADIAKETTTENEEEDPIGMNPEKLKNQGFQLSLGYKF